MRRVNLSFTAVTRLNEWNPDIEDIRAKVTDRTKAILVINPNNPTGRGI